jgi:hypothetical protein
MHTTASAIVGFRHTLLTVPARVLAQDASPAVTDEVLEDFLSATSGWHALELTWGALSAAGATRSTLKPLLAAALAESARLGASLLVVSQLDVDEVLARYLIAMALAGFPCFQQLRLVELNIYDESIGSSSCGARKGSPQAVCQQDRYYGRCWGCCGAGRLAASVTRRFAPRLPAGHLSGALHSAEHLESLQLEGVWASGPAWSALCAALKVNGALTTLE